ncbi:MAG: VanW family protein [Acidimicrobiales bacterium]
MPKHAKGRRSTARRVAVWAGLPLAVLALLVGAWALDTEVLAGEVVRNVEVAGRAVGGSDDEGLTAALDDYAVDLAGTPVQLVNDATTYPTTAGELGVSLDAEATRRRLLDAGHGFLPWRPFRWAASFVAGHDVTPVLVVDRARTGQAIIDLEGDARTPPTEPALTLADDGTMAVVPGVPGSGIDAGEVAARLPGVLASVEPDTTVRIEVEPTTIAPRLADEGMQALADQANALTAAPLTVNADGNSAEVPPETVRTWIRAVPGDAGAQPTLAVDQDAAVASLTEQLPDLGNPPVDASFDLQGGVPVVIPGQDGTACCGPDTAPRVLAALQAQAGAVDVDLITSPPTLTTEAAQALGVTQAVGGSRAWPESRQDEAGAGFTTFHAAGQSRVTNIHRIADLVRGALILPGGQFSVNDYVGRRTTANGFVAAGAIRNGEHVQEVGGGVSQFATTLFNSAYFAGLDIAQYQAHTESFDRYPRGREATMGFPNPDLVIENNTPYGVLIWTSYTSSSLTITMYSTPFAMGEQTGISEGRSGNCRVVTTTRTRTFVDGREPVTDTFSATYRPGEGQFC